MKAAADGVPGQGDQRIKLAVSLLDGPQVVAEALPESGSSLLGHEVGTSDERGVLVQPYCCWVSYVVISFRAVWLSRSSFG